MLTPLVSLQQGNIKKSKESIKIVNIEGEIFISSVRLEEFQWNIQERQD